MTLTCAHCLLAGKRIPTKLDHIGMERYASALVVTIIDGNALCGEHTKKVLAEQKTRRGGSHTHG